MSWWQRIFGTRTPEVPFPVRLDDAAGLVVHVHRHDIPSRGGPVHCWTYVTEGFRALGQREFVFSLRRDAKEEPAAFPQEPVDFFGQLLPLVQQGRVVGPGDYTIFSPPNGFLGHEGVAGFAYLPLQTHAGVTGLPPSDAALTLVLLQPDEAHAVQQVGIYRLTGLLGEAARYYPCPPWNDRGRPALLTRDDLEESLLSKVPLVHYKGATARQVARSGRIELRLPARDRAPFAEQAVKEEGGWHFAVLTEPDREADARLVWRPGQKQAHGISPDGAAGECVGGNFLLVVANKDARTGAHVVEDGFCATFAPADAERVRAAIGAGELIVVEAGEDGRSAFALVWTDEPEPPASRGGPFGAD